MDKVHSPLDQIAQRPIQPGHFQEQATHKSSGQPLSMPHQPHSKKFLSYIKSKLTVFLFEAIPPPACQPHHTAWG